MVRPYRHLKTGVYWLRKTVPEALRPRVGKRELISSLKTKDPREATRLAPRKLAEFNAILAEAQAEPTPLTQKERAALVGEWYRRQVALWGDDPDDLGDLTPYRDLLLDQVDSEDGPDGRDVITVTPHDLAEATELLKHHGFPTDRKTARRLARDIFPLRLRFLAEMERRRGGDWSPDPTAVKFPPLVPRKAPEAAPRVIFTSLLAGWAAETGTTGKALYDRERTALMLARFLGHEDAARVTAEDIVRWKEARLGAGRSLKTVANDIGELRSIWTWARRNRKLAFAENPFSGVAPKAKRRGQRPRGPFTREEARRVLEAARAERDPLLRWLPWAACFTGARLGELTQSVKEDVRREGSGPWFLHIHEAGEGRTLKTEQSERQVPLHPALIEEGFLRYVQALPAASPLFPGLRPDRFGVLKGMATRKHGQWVRRVVGIVDKSKDPAHAWRHRFEDEGRRAGLPQEVLDALVGHLNAKNESAGYGHGYPFMPDTTAPWVAQMASPLANETE
jgi:integrase